MAKSYLQEQADHAERLATNIGAATEKTNQLSDAINKANGLALADSAGAGSDLINTGAGGNRQGVDIRREGGVGEGAIPDAGGALRGVSGNRDNSASRANSASFIAMAGPDGRPVPWRGPWQAIIGVVAHGVFYPGQPVPTAGGGFSGAILGPDGADLVHLIRESNSLSGGGPAAAGGPSAGIGSLPRPPGGAPGSLPPVSVPPAAPTGGSNGAINTQSPDVVAELRKQTGAIADLAAAIRSAPSLGTLVRSTR